MKKLLLACALALAVAPSIAWAGEGNGPNFPGLQRVNEGFTTSVADPYSAPAPMADSAAPPSTTNAQQQPVRRDRNG